MLTHRDCGAAFLHGYVRADMDFVWDRPSGPLSDGRAIDLIPIEILVEDAVHPGSRHKEMWLHVPTGRLRADSPSDLSGYRLVRVHDKPAVAPEIAFDECPVCMRRTRASKDEPSKVMDHVTKGEAPFTTLVRGLRSASWPGAATSGRQWPPGFRRR